MDYRNVCCFLIFILSFACYEFYKENKKLSEIIIDQEEMLVKQNETIIYQNNVLKGDTIPGFMIDLAHKDMGLALEMASILKSPTPLGAVANQF